jgi:hypothetical protein
MYAAGVITKSPELIAQGKAMITLEQGPQWAALSAAEKNQKISHLLEAIKIGGARTELVPDSLGGTKAVQFHDPVAGEATAQRLGLGMGPTPVPKSPTWTIQVPNMETLLANSKYTPAAVAAAVARLKESGTTPEVVRSEVLPLMKDPKAKALLEKAYATAPPAAVTAPAPPPPPPSKIPVPVVEDPIAQQNLADYYATRRTPAFAWPSLPDIKSKIPASVTLQPRYSRGLNSRGN